MANTFDQFRQQLNQVSSLTIWTIKLYFSIKLFNARRNFFSQQFKATCFTRRFGKSPEYTGDFPCTLYSCTGCHHALVSGQDVIGFPFKLEEQIGKGGFASVYRGKFHQGQAAFKFVPIKNEQTYTYRSNAVGCYEYYQQEVVMNYLLRKSKIIHNCYTLY